MLEWLAANWTQVVGFATGALCVILAARRNIWTFPLGIANNIVFFVLFIESALYADAGLQVVYVVLGIMGWVNWARHGGADDRALVARTPARAVLPLVLATLATAAVLIWALTTFSDSTTEVADATTTAVSLAAQYMLNRRWIENWFVWIAVDIAYVGLYLVKGLWIVGLLYGLFIALAVWGLRSWARSARVQRAPTPQRVSTDA